MNATQRQAFVDLIRSQLEFPPVGAGPDQRPPCNIILITDPGKDLDDEQAIILAAGLYHAKIINLTAVVANLDPAVERAKLARGTLNLLGLPTIPVGIGSNVFWGGSTEKHECDCDYGQSVDSCTLLNGQALLHQTLLAAESRSLTWVLNSGLSDAALCLMSNPRLFVEKTKEVIIMGGVQDPHGFNHNGVFTTGPDRVNYLTPDTAANNAYDWPAAIYLYQALQELMVPLCIVMRWMPYACQFPFSLYERFAATGNPIGANLLRRQAHSINSLWKAANSGPGAVRGKLPMDRDRQWFVGVFCKDVDPGVDRDAEIWPYVGDYNQYDALALAMAVPALRDRYTEPTGVAVKGVQHQIIGIAEDQPGLKDGDGLRKLVAEIQIGALAW
ncbi:nucleoside hydrolase [uncultured Thiodictyon sp.]|uniref:nucleoside hydrolase n=1 Tax=uncultured Thiodictyon sp. TaxID=1846217 RepID=UPI0025D66534|nr:nucleoside hydrolase [uncultured Thiodictyon sp.]